MVERITESLAEFVSEISIDHVPAEAAEIVAAGFADTVGVMLAGTHEDVVSVLVRTSGDHCRLSTGARVCLSSLRMDAPEAALIGGTAAHALDYDDVAFSCHPSAVLVPAILAEGETLSSHGSDLVAAYVAGFEVLADLSRRNRDYHIKGWHPTSLFGPVAAAAAVAVLHGLSKTQTANALAIAASHSGGLVANFGTMTKPYHAGRAAHDGVVAARLAANGMTGAASVFEDSQGFLTAISAGTEPNRDSKSKLGNEWNIIRGGVNIKRYPTCYATHRSIDAAIELVKQYDLTARDILSIRVSMGANQVRVLRNSRPDTVLEAKFSEEFAIACAVVHRNVGIRELSEHVIKDSEIRRLFDKVTTIGLDEHDPENSVFSPVESVVITLVDGSELSARDIRYPKGHARNPLSPSELWTKFADCVEHGGEKAVKEELYKSLMGIQRLESASDIPTVKSVLTQMVHSACGELQSRPVNFVAEA